MKTLLLSGLLLLTPLLWAEPSEHPVPIIPKDFHALKQLLGTWQGKEIIGNKSKPANVSYELTAGGTAITETLMKGSPHEMVSVYHKDGDGVAMTHYCSLGNQPHMKLKSSNGKTLVFEMEGAVGIQSINEPHMHALTLALSDANTLEHRWAHFSGGKKTGSVVFKFQRD